MNDQQGAWERQYRAAKQVWCGSPARLPVVSEHARVLELGCGNGKTLAALCTHSSNVVALDLSLSALRTCAGREDCAGAQLIGADIRNLPIQNTTFDVVLAHHVIGHLNTEGREKAADTIIRILRPGGILSVQEFSVDDFRYGSGTETEKSTFLRGNGISTHYFTQNELSGLFPELTQQYNKEMQWMMRVRGRDYLRSVLTYEFKNVHETIVSGVV
jgi:SAM-dependent methyltransferase